MCHKLARLFAALFLTAGVCGVSHAEIVRFDWADSNGPAAAIPDSAVVTPVSFNSAVPNTVVEFLNSPLRSTDLNPSPQQVVHQQPVIAPPVESQMVPLPPSFWTGMTGLLGLGFVRAGKRIRKTFL